jgi:hypothetical protein
VILELHQIAFQVDRVYFYTAAYFIFAGDRADQYGDHIATYVYITIGTPLK